MSSYIEALKNAPLDPEYYAKVVAYIYVSGHAMVQGKLINNVGGSAVSGFVTSPLSLLIKRVAVQQTPAPIKVASALLVGLNWAVKVPLGGVIFFGQETLKRLLQYSGKGGDAPQIEVKDPTSVGDFNSPGTAVIDKVPATLDVEGVISYLFQGSDRSPRCRYSDLRPVQDLSTVVSESEHSPRLLDFGLSHYDLNGG